MDKHHSLLNPGELVEVGDTIYRLRYITYHGVTNTYYFSPGNEKLSPFVQNDVLILSVGKEESLRLKVFED